MLELPSYRGDIINELAFTPEARIPDPAPDAAGLYPGRRDAEPAARLLDRRLRRRAPGPFLDAGLHREPKRPGKYRDMANRISDTLDFMKAAGLDRDSNAQRCRRWISTPATKRCCWNTRRRSAGSIPPRGKWLAGSGHMIWIGDRTRQPDGAHVEFARGVQNPIGLKCGPTTTAEDLKVLMARLNPANEAGRADADRALRRGQGGRTSAAARQGGAGGGRQRRLGPAIRCTATRSSPRPATRPGPSICVLREVREFFAVHKAEGTIPGGVHFEMTGQDVTECTGGVHAVTDEDLSRPLPYRLRSAPQRAPIAGTGLPRGRGTDRRAARPRTEGPPAPEPERTTCPRRRRGGARRQTSVVVDDQA